MSRARSDETWPVGPLQVWVRDRRRAMVLSGVERPNEIIGWWLGVHADSVNRWMARRVPVSEDFVDQVLTRSGRGASIEDVYGLGSADEAECVPARRRCGWGGGCKDRAEFGGRFCGEHALILAGIREEMEQEGSTMSRAGGSSLVESRRLNGKPRPKEPICCAQGCFEPRLSGDRFCMSCQADGLVEEEVFAA